MGRRFPVAALTIAVSVIAGALGIAFAERTLGSRIDDEMATHAASLLPGGSVAWADMTDDPALLAGLAEQWDHTMAMGTDASGSPVRMSIIGYNREASRAVFVSWSLLDREFARGMLSAIAIDVNVGEGVIAGRAVRVQLAAYVDGDEVAVVPLGITLDGVLTEADDLPTEIATVLAPVRIPLPASPEGSELTVSSVAMDGSMVIVYLGADDVPLGAAG